MKIVKTTLALFLLGLSGLTAPLAAADNIAACEVLIAERIEDEGTGGSALISSYRPAGAFISSVYDDEPGHIREVDGHNIRAVLCERRSAVPSLRDYPIIETGIPLTLSQNFDSAKSDVVIIRFKDGAFQASYTGPGLTPQAQAELDDVVAVFNLQPNDLAQREAAQTVETDAESKGASEPNETSVPLKAQAPDINIVTLSASEDGLNGSAFTDEVAEEKAVQADIVSAAAEPEILLETVLTDTPITEAAPPDTAIDEIITIETTNDKANTVQEASASPLAGPPIEAEAPPPETCQIIARDGLGQIQELPVSTEALYKIINDAPVFILPVPPGLNLRALRCIRLSLTPRANDYKVARAGYAFFYQVEGTDERAAALEFARGKFRMNLVEGDFTAQELIDAKARILSFNDQHLKVIQAQRKDVK